MFKHDQSKRIIEQLIQDENIKKPLTGATTFFLNKAIESLLLSRRILEISQNKEDSLKSFMWVISTAYYSMFYAATALLAAYDRKISSEIGIHKLTYHAIVYYFIIQDNKLQKHFIDEYKEMYNNAEELLQLSEKMVLEAVENFKFEQEKRKIFTYETGRIAEEQKAITSYQRAEKFINEIRLMISKK